jgi:hypothetical protein
MKTILRWLLAIACLAYLAKFFYDSRSDLSIAVALNGWILAGIVILQLVYYYLQGERLRIVMKKCSGRDLPIGPWMKLFIIGRFLNTIFAQAGNISRGIILKRDYGVSYTRYIAANASMAWMDTGMNFLVVAAIVLIFSPGFPIGPFVAWKVLGLFAVATIAAPVVFEAAFRRLRFGFGPLVWLHNKSAEVLKVSVENLADGMYLLKIVVLGLAVFARTVLLYHLYFLTLGIHLDFATLAVFYAFSKLSFYVNLTPGNLGVQEILWGALGELVGIGMAQGVLVSGLARVFNTSVILLLGAAIGGRDLFRNRGQLPASNGNTPSAGEE